MILKQDPELYEGFCLDNKMIVLKIELKKKENISCQTDPVS